MKLFTNFINWIPLILVLYGIVRSFLDIQTGLLFVIIGILLVK